jgi:hypothetical protein
MFMERKKVTMRRNATMGGRELKVDVDFEWRADIGYIV